MSSNFTLHLMRNDLEKASENPLASMVLPLVLTVGGGMPALEFRSTGVGAVGLGLELTEN